MKPIDVARDEWPALRWREARAPGFVRLRGTDRRGWHVVTASKWVGEGWRVTSGDVAWHHCVSLRDGLRRVRHAL